VDVLRVIAWRYRHDTLILESVHELAGGSVRVIDFMSARAWNEEKQAFTQSYTLIGMVSLARVRGWSGS
jgi:hypothetical protein